MNKGMHVAHLREEFPMRVGFSVSLMTRALRDGEVDDVLYRFSSVDGITAGIAREELAENTDVPGRFYGNAMSAKAVEV